MRTFLNTLYKWSGILSGLLIILICLVILARVVGRWLGIVVPSSDDFAGYLLASASFLALAYSFRSGAHIRVNLFISRLSLNHTLLVERVVLVITTCLVGYLAWQLSNMVWESWAFEEVTSGYIPMPLWVVQLPMAIGMVIFFVSIADLTYGHFFSGLRIPKSEEEEIAESDPIVDNSPVQGAHHE